jgi:thiol-disulfide isomerase/thioredoxin
MFLFAGFSLLLSCQEGSKEMPDDGTFVIEGTVPLPDGYTAGLCIHTDTAFSVEACPGDTIVDGHFTLKGQVDKPYQGTLMTNNLALVEKNGWPVDSIHWTYSEVFLSSGRLTFTGQDEASFRLKGTQVQSDYNELLEAGGQHADPWTFIDSHPESVVSVWLANQLTDRAYRLTREQVEHLQQTVKGSPADTARYALFLRKVEAAAKTVKNSPLTDLQLIDIKGDTCRLADVVPQGYYVLIDFWASWCGICLYSMPAISALQEQYSDRLRVIAISIDTKEEAWRHAMEQHPHSWPQYMTTAQGYDDFFTKYQVGNGVPYYLLLSPERLVVGSPSSPEEAEEMISLIKNK